MNKKGSVDVLVLLVILTLFISIGGYMAINGLSAHKKNPTNGAAVACTLEAKVCPDGSSVGRSGPNCEFAKCQDSSSTADTVQRNDWGLVFAKGSDWNVIENGADRIVLEGTSDQSNGDKITASYVPSNSITDVDAKFGNVTYFYDSAKQQWMAEGNGYFGKGFIENVATSAIVAVPKFYVDMHPVFIGTGRWETFIIPISETSFLKLNITGSGYAKPLDEIVSTLKFSSR
jgi:hypothetical protein